MSGWNRLAERVTDSGWRVITITLPDHAYVKVTCISPDGQRVVKLDKVDPERAARLDPVTEWRRR